MKLFRLLLALAIICTAQTAIAQVNQATSTFNDSKVNFSEVIDKFEVIDPETGAESVVYRKRLTPSELNGAPIYYNDEATQPVGAAAKSTLENYLRTNLLLQELNDNRGTIDNMDIVIDEKGNVGFARIFFRSTDVNKMATMQQAIEKKLKSKTFIPAQKGGKPVAYGINITGL